MAKLTDHDYWKNFDWSFKRQKEHVNKGNECCSFVWWQLLPDFDKERIRSRNKTLPEGFDEMFDFLKEYLIGNESFISDYRIKGSLWVRHLFM